MSKSRSRQLQEQSLELALAAVETYNKPRFPAREHTFQILMCAAWEALVKAQLVALAGNQINAIQVKLQNGQYKKNRHGDRITIGAVEGMRKLRLDDRIIDNFEALEKLRDASVHLPIPTKGHKLVLFSIASASLKNYAELSRIWFGASLKEVDWYILPLGFDFPFKRFTLLDFQDEPEIIRRLIASFAEKSARDYGDDDQFSLLCEIDIELKSVKKLPDGFSGLSVGVDPESEEHFAVKQRDKLATYRLEYRDILKKLKEQCPCIKQSDLNSLISSGDIKNNSQYSEYSYTSHRQMLQGPKSGTKSIYNHDFLRHAISKLVGLKQCGSCPASQKQ